MKNVRNIAIVLGIAALLVAVPGGGTGATVATQAVSLVFLGAIAWVGSIMYRQHRSELYSLGDARRAVLYAAVGVAALTLTATSQLWTSSGGKLAWFVLLAAAGYAAFAVVWSARKY